MTESSTPQKLIVNDYKLALKFFMNKDFGKSFLIISKLHEVCYRNFEKGLLDEEVFIKIVSLYLTEIGLLLNAKETNSTFQLSRAERKEFLKKLENSTMLDTLYGIYGSIALIPLELLFQIMLVNFTCKNAIKPDDPRHLLKQFEKLYTRLNFTDSSDKYMKRLVDMYVFNVLPEADEFSKAFQVIQDNPFLDYTVALAKLRELEELKRHDKKLRDKQIKQRETNEAKLEEERLARKKEEDERKNLKYMSLKQIRKEHETDGTSKREKPGSASNYDIEKLKSKMLYLLQLSKDTFQKNSAFILVVLALAFISTKFLRSRKINIREKLLETLKMAFKVTYL